MVERDDRAPVATFYSEHAFAAGDVVALSAAAAHHARVKRLEVGDLVRVTDGVGSLGYGPLDAIAKERASVRIEELVRVPQPRPIHLLAPISDRDRMLTLAEKAAEFGIATWRAVKFKRSASVSPRGEGSAFAQKVRARMIGALEQSGGAWLPEIRPDITLEALLVDGRAPGILLDVAGEALLGSGRLAVETEPIVLFGPEGGIDADERARLIMAGWRAVRLANTTLRFETAGIAAIAVLRAAQLLEES